MWLFKACVLRLIVPRNSILHTLQRISRAWGNGDAAAGDDVFTFDGPAVESLEGEVTVGALDGTADAGAGGDVLQTCCPCCKPLSLTFAKDWQQGLGFHTYWPSVNVEIVT